MDLQLVLVLVLVLQLVRQPTATVEGELNSNSSSYTVPEGVCFRILRSIEGGTAVSPVSDNSRLKSITLRIVQLLRPTAAASRVCFLPTSARRVS
jgi:hypothetical protein